MEGAGQDSAGVRNALADLEERLGPQVERARETLDNLNRRALRVMREYPGTCLLGAIAAGFLLGRLASRR